MSETPASFDTDLDILIQEEEEKEQTEHLADLITRRRRYFEDSKTVRIDQTSALIGARLGRLWRSTYLASLGPDDKFLPADDFRDKVETAKTEALATMRSQPEYTRTSFDDPVMIAATDAFLLMSPAPVSDGEALGWGMEPYSDTFTTPTQRG